MRFVTKMVWYEVITAASDRKTKKAPKGNAFGRFETQILCLPFGKSQRLYGLIIKYLTGKINCIFGDM